MTGPTADLDGAEPVDRRWFEEALRSQGFVVEPPADDAEADPPAIEAAEPAVEPEVPAATPLVERPPMPSALLARIAARGQPGAVIAPEPEPVAVVTPTTEASEPQPVVEPIAAAPADADATAPAVTPTPDEARLAPWASAVAAPIAPWAAPSDTPPIAQPDPEPEPGLEPEPEADPEPEPESDPVALDVPDTEVEPDPVALDLPGAEAGSEPVADEMPTAPATLDQAVSLTLADEAVDEASDAPVILEPIDPDEVTDSGAPIELPASPAAVLDSPYAPVGATAAAAIGSPRPVPVAAGPEASEGELWALVGASEPTATKAPASEVVRVILTILSAFLILVIVVGALVLASQIA